MAKKKFQKNLILKAHQIMKTDGEMQMCLWRAQ